MPRTRNPPPPPSPETREAALEAIGAAPGPLTAAAVAKLLAAPHRIRAIDLPPILAEFAAAGRLHEFPPATARGRPQYWHKSPQEFARLALLRSADAQGPQTRAKLRKSARGLNNAQFDEIVNALVSQRALFRHPPIGRSKTELLGARPPSPAVYLQGVAAQLQKVVDQLTAAQVPRDQLRRALVELIELVESAGVPLEGASPPRGVVPPPAPPRPVDLLALMRRLEAGAERGALIGARALRQVANLEKSQFDRLVLELAQDGRLSLHRHDFASSLSPAERDELVTDGQGTYFVGMAIRHSGG
jgi:hypothetical protein